ncbi:SRPBCC family protein [Amycolatopsis suaedae]|uniref:SRPBCC family protein n=1 Tax=Amycolatopsis suaedae TaxID=2510978 RepID=A0A4Q7JA41_9PSEU|nr:SRPBCC family protein [Amycolatopsis suaedae]RZQ63878.1 SRPBCC family protein [Amycolatopsis suaedae]
MIDVKHEISAVSRTVGSRTLEAGTARVVTIRRTYDAPLEDVWDACTSADRLPRWFLPVTGDLVEGGRYQFEGNAGGTVTGCDKPNGFTATWEYGGEVSWIEVRFTAEGDERTEFRLEHIAHVEDERWTQFGPGAVGVGWDLGLMGLGMHLASGEPVDRASAGEWSESDEGKEFSRLSSEAWYEASVASGTPEPEARAAADRTTAFYTGA